MERDMRIGSACKYQGGFAYMLLLISVALIGIAAAGSVSLGAAVARRHAEQELLVIGAEFERALSSYAGLPSALQGGSLPAGAHGPRELGELLKDPRVPGIRRHLRQLYSDPLTGNREWGLVRDSEGFIMGVYSLAPGVPIKQSGWPPRWTRFDGQQTYALWVFGFASTRSPPPAP